MHTPYASPCNLHHSIISITKIDWSFIKASFCKHLLTDAQTGVWMHINANIEAQTYTTSITKQKPVSPLYQELCPYR